MNLARKTASATIASSFAAFALFGMSLGAMAQDATPAPAAPTSGMTAAIHQGSCQQPDAQPVVDLGTFGQPTNSDGSVTQTQGIQTGPPLLQAAASGLELNLTDTLGSGQAYVILVHQSSEQYSTYLACGELSGPVIDNNLAVGLRPINNGGFAGVATLKATDGKTDSTVYLMSDLLALSGGQTVGTPMAQPTPIAAQGTFPPTVPPTAAPTETPAPPTQAPTAPPTVPPTPAPTATVAPTATPAPVQITTTPQVIEVTPTPAA
jgi:hypothetical protein